ncbi:hypothetical protein Back2_13370 [Nocardioides baekrokdamisoli]|uniref:Uncharacterized protein n=1 Tax=Nocardioides baekrokdamisoli TaxID=1804624 RepID=A0A3G9IDJ9_9ACTN|nr:hypothetical protein Back2_13370 [Nocardioides baekrokdamisoli]
MPGTLALQERYASLTDPIPELRAAVTAAREWADRVFVINGSARRTQASPGPFDERAVPFDEALFTALTGPDVARIRSTDQRLATELWATVGSAPDLADALASKPWQVSVDYHDAPTGVAWWVIRYAS